MRRPRPPRTARPPQGLPSAEALLKFIRESGETDRGEIARAFGLKGGDRRALREMLRDLEERGQLDRRGRKGVAEPDGFPPVGVADVVERDPDGDLFVRLTKAGEMTKSV